MISSENTIDSVQRRRRSRRKFIPNDGVKEKSENAAAKSEAGAEIASLVKRQDLTPQSQPAKVETNGPNYPEILSTAITPNQPKIGNRLRLELTGLFRFRKISNGRYFFIHCKIYVSTFNEYFF